MSDRTGSALPPARSRLAAKTDETEGCGIVVSWPRDEVPPRPREEMPPPLVGLLRTRDGGRRWKAEPTWEGPRNADLNERHQITLDVR